MQNRRSLQNMEHDEFDKLVSSLLDGYSVPVDANCWNEIEKKINTKQRKHIWRYLCTAVAVMGVLMISVYTLVDRHITETVTTDFTVDAPMSEELGTTVKIEEANNWDKLVEKKEIVEKDDIASPLKQKSRVPKTIVQASDNENIGNKEGETTQIVANLDTDVLVSSSDSIQVNKEKKGSKPNNNSLLSNEPQLLAMAKQSKGWTFGMGMGTGGGISLPDANGSDAMMDSEIGNGHPEIPNYNDLLQYQEWDMNYNFPVSFGFLIRRNFNPTIGIESGLVYTYLSTDMKRRAGHLSQKGTFQLHYIGIPINAVCNLYTNSNWKIYLSAGIMLEKGITSSHKTITYEGDKEKTIDKKNDTWIRGTQWSLNGGVGISYGITKTLDLYIEPKVSYYFDNRQPISIRTDQSTIFNINAGLKFNLK